MPAIIRRYRQFAYLVITVNFDDQYLLHWLINHLLDDKVPNCN